MAKFEDSTIYLAQVGLNSLGFGPLKTDGRLGDFTRGAISAFERANADAERANAAQGQLPLSRSVNPAGLALITHFEGLFLTAYKCPADVWTIGYGHTGITHKDGTVKPGRKITKEEAERLLVGDLEKFAKRVVEAVKVPVSDDQFSALVSFDFNTGGLLKSTLLRKLNAGDYAGAADEFLKWNKAGGKVLSGLTRRRKSERNLFLGITPTIVPA